MKELHFFNLRMLFLLITILLVINGFAQQPNLEFSSLSELESLSDIKATAITQDANGYLWIGTQEGLFRFDGQTVYTYLHEDNDQNALPSSKILKLFADSRKNLWITTQEGLCRYNPEFDNFTPFKFEPSAYGVMSLYFTTVAEDQSGQLYVATEKTIYKFDPSQKKLAKVIDLKEGEINNFIFDTHNNIWIACTEDGGLHYFDQNTRQLTAFRNDPANKQSVSNQEISDIALLRDKLWIGTYGKGIDCYDTREKTFKHYITPYYYENYTTNFTIDSRKNLWVNTLGALKLFDPKTDSFYNYYNQPNNPRSLSLNLLRFYEDQQGNYWSLHSVGGVRVVKSLNKFMHYDTRAEKTWFTLQKNITCVSYDGSGSLWIGNSGNGIDVFNWKKHRIDRYVHKDTDQGSLGNGTIFCVFCDSKKQMWIGSNMGGLQKFIPETGKFESYLNRPNDTLSIANNDIRSISEDAGGNLWIAVHGKGVDRFDPKTKIFHHHNTKNNKLSQDYTFQVYNDSNGNLWVATAWALSLLRKGESLFKYFMFDKNDSTTISNDIISSIYEDGQHNIWIGTHNGLNRFNPKTQSFSRYSAGLKNKHVCSILSDRKNNIWVSTNTGISKFDSISHHFTNYDQSDGLLSRAFNDRSCCKNGKGEMIWGGFEGIDYFNPDSLITEAQPPRVVLTNFKLFNKSITYRNNSEIIEKHISFADKIVLNYQNNSFTIFYQGLDLANYPKISYTYRLDGFDKEWVNAETKREANYSNLNPGNYTFRVKAKYNDESWNVKETTIRLIIVPAWWMTLWFKALMVLLLLITPIGWFQLRIRRLRNQKGKLEKIVAERTSEIQSKNELLKDLNSTKDKLFSVISHDLRSPFNAILGFESLLIHNYYDFTDIERIDMISQVHTTSNQLYILVENLLNWAKLQNSTIQHYPVEFKLKEVILEKSELYQYIAEVKGITITHEIPDEITAYADIHLMETILRNLISNAIKFTTAGGSILVIARQMNSTIEISVTDTGTGMTSEQIDTLFSLETTQPKFGTSGEKGSGLGLVLCKEFVEKNGGKINVESQPGKGSTFRFTIPAAKAKMIQVI